MLINPFQWLTCIHWFSSLQWITFGCDLTALIMTHYKAQQETLSSSLLTLASVSLEGLSTARPRLSKGLSLREHVITVPHPPVSVLTCNNCAPSFLCLCSHVITVPHPSCVITVPIFPVSVLTCNNCAPSFLCNNCAHLSCVCAYM